MGDGGNFAGGKGSEEGKGHTTARRDGEEALCVAINGTMQPVLKATNDYAM
ncbi:hypothetical protein HPP92_012445 [Vanilla planifolia]|uniref:Uncharacterized protein n=1 Tax=Vanilla planifolia TaxID=51239 RepID=A0A835R8Z9_VANPL|nr:hypothetical protein HPP92_012445 [Vanilla planifolia]